MKPSSKIALVVILIAVLISCTILSNMSLWQGKNDLYNAGIIDEINDLSNAKTSKFETKGTISGLELYLDGHIDGNGIMKIGENDSTVYKKYDLNPGVISIEFKSDWYSEFCFVTFEPVKPAKGKIRIICNFVGD
jgi:hypothetical protein